MEMLVTWIGIFFTLDLLHNEICTKKDVFFSLKI